MIAPSVPNSSGKPVSCKVKKSVFSIKVKESSVQILASLALCLKMRCLNRLFTSSNQPVRLRTLP